MIRSVGAVLGGFILIALLTVGTGELIRMAIPGAFGPDGIARGTGMLLASQVYVGVYAVAGCYLTARWAGRRPMLHAMVLGVLGLVFNVIGAVGAWEAYPAWYWVLALALVLPFAWVGGRLREVEEAREKDFAAAMAQPAAASSRSK